MLYTVRSILSLGTVLLLAIGCQSKASVTLTANSYQFGDSFPESDFGVAIPVADTNSSLTLYVPPEVNDFKLNSWAQAIILSHIDKPLWFPLDHGLRLFLYSEATQLWTEIKNQAVVETPTNLNISEIIIEPNGFSETAFVPDISGATSPQRIRMFIVGRIYENAQPTDKDVAAYVDFVLQP